MAASSRLRRLAFLGLAWLLTACGELPHPFEHEGPNALLEDRKAMTAVAVQPVEGQPALAEAVAAALGQEDIAAFCTPGDDGSYRLQATLEETALVWHLTTAKGAPLAETRTPVFVPGPLSPQVRDATASQVARTVAEAVRGVDSGLADIESWPRVQVRAVDVPTPLDGAALARTLTQALAGNKVNVVDSNYVAVVVGKIDFSRRPGDDDQANVVWRVLDAKGTQIAAISQSGPVPRLYQSGNMGSVGRQIAEAGATAIATVARKLNSLSRGE